MSTLCIIPFFFNGDQQNQIVNLNITAIATNTPKQRGDWILRSYLAPIILNLREIEVEVDLR